VLQRVAKCRQIVALWPNVLGVCCIVLQCFVRLCFLVRAGWICVAVCCSVLQSVAVRCSVLQCVALCYNVLQCRQIVALHPTSLVMCVHAHIHMRTSTLLRMSMHAHIHIRTSVRICSCACTIACHIWQIPKINCSPPELVSVGLDTYMCDLNQISAAFYQKSPTFYKTSFYSIKRAIKRAICVI